MKEKKIVRAQCYATEYTDEWVDFDVSGWTIREYRTIPDVSLDQALGQWVEVDSTDWHITGTNGESVPHPGRGAESKQWLNAYKELPIERAHWLSLTPYQALREACQPSKKRTESSEDGGAKAAG